MLIVAYFITHNDADAAEPFEHGIISAPGQMLSWVELYEAVVQVASFETTDEADEWLEQQKRDWHVDNNDDDEYDEDDERGVPDGLLRVDDDGTEVVDDPYAHTYKIIRFYSPADGRDNETVRTGLDYDEARAHCNDPTTRQEGVYFDGFEREN